MSLQIIWFPSNHLKFTLLRFDIIPQPSPEKKEVREMNWQEKNRKRYDALSDEDQAKFYLLAMAKGYTDELKREPDRKIPLSKIDKQKSIKERIVFDYLPATISGSEEEWEEIFLLTTQTYKNYSYNELSKSLKRRREI